MKNIILPTSPGQPGTLAEVTSLLAEAGVNIRSFDAHEDEDHGLISMYVDDYDEALILLKQAGFHPISEDALVVRVLDEPGALARIANRFKEAHINLRSLHIVHRSDGSNLASLVTSDNEAARKLLSDLSVS